MFRELTRIKQQISTEECIQVLKEETRGVLSVNGDDGYPYGMPMNHWYNEEDGAIYFHSGKKGYRPEVLKKDNKVSYCVYDKGFKREGEWAWNVKSVIIFGKMELIEDLDTIADITRKLSYKFTDDTDYIEYEIRESSKNTLLMKLVPEHMCGKLVNEA
ncbi:MAG: pyridoxamine 5'-phosphate oxidase family protein [Firmicutes bacterium]|nr:pyridoxamine 5'-phosphate oxidase family protein [Bacillota bacterium]